MKTTTWKIKLFLTEYMWTSRTCFCQHLRNGSSHNCLWLISRWMDNSIMIQICLEQVLRLISCCNMVMIMSSIRLLVVRVDVRNSNIRWDSSKIIRCLSRARSILCMIVRSIILYSLNWINTVESLYLKNIKIRYIDIYVDIYIDIYADIYIDIYCVIFDRNSIFRWRYLNNVRNSKTNTIDDI